MELKSKKLFFILILSQLINSCSSTEPVTVDTNDQLRTGVNAKKYSNDFYNAAWQKKVLQVGKFNYPHATVSKNMTGTLTLDVQINADGSVFNVIILKSSGYKTLDSAAIRIANLASPYAALPPEILEKTSIYSIVREWRFELGKSIF